MLQGNTREKSYPSAPQTPTRLNLLHVLWGTGAVIPANLRQELQQNGVWIPSAFSIFLLQEMHQGLDGHLPLKPPHAGLVDQPLPWQVL